MHEVVLLLLHFAGSCVCVCVCCSKQLLILLIFLHKFLHNRFFNEDDGGKQRTTKFKLKCRSCSTCYMFGMQLAPLVKYV